MLDILLLSGSSGRPRHCSGGCQGPGVAGVTPLPRRGAGAAVLAVERASWGQQYHSLRLATG